MAILPPRPARTGGLSKSLWSEDITARPCRARKEAANVRVHVAITHDEAKEGTMVDVAVFKSRAAATKYYDDLLMGAYRDGKNVSGYGVKRMTVRG